MRFLALLLLLLPIHAQAFPELARHGYTNCITCHASPTGGGILTEYGRAIAKEVLSHGSFFFEKKMDLQAPLETQDEQFMNGNVTLPKGFSVGGDARGLQYVVDNPRQTSGRFILMQADLEAAYSDGKRFTIDGTIGRAEPRGKAGYANDFLLSRRHWIAVKMGPEEAMDRYQLRFGRFFPAYGINIPDHSAVVRKGIGFDEQQESYNAELSYIAEEWSVFATSIMGRPDHPDRSKEAGGALQVSKAIGTTYRVGANGFYGKDSTRAAGSVRRMLGAFALMGFKPDLYALADASLTHDDISRTGFVQYLSGGWEFSQGVHLVATEQYSKLSLRKGDTWVESQSLGLRYFPRVHWDFQANVGRERRSAVSLDYDRFLIFIAHYYL